MTIGKKITILRKRMGYTQEDLANELDVSRQSVYKWETDAAIPDLNNIKRMAKLFNVSFDKLLDEEVDITLEEVAVEETAAPPVRVKRQYREVFVSGETLAFRQADIDHGYTSDRKRRNPESDWIYDTRTDKMKRDLRELGISSYILLQDDLAGCFFEDTKNMVFGFYFNGAVQFVCPYENFINANISNSGNEMGYERQMMIGAGFGSDGINSIGVGSMPRAVLKKPSVYYLRVNYFDKEGNAKDYKMKLFCTRAYNRFEHKELDGAILDNFLSDSTNSRLNDIYSKLSSVPAIAERIRCGDIQVKELNVSSIKVKHAVQYKASSEHLKRVTKSAREDNERWRRNLCIGLSILGAIILLLIILLA